jgi:transposase
MSQTLSDAVAVIGIDIDIGKSSFHVVGLSGRGAIVLRQKWSRGQVEARFANTPPCLIGVEACVGAHHLSRKLKTLGHHARLMPAKYVRPCAKGQKNDFRDAEAIAEASPAPHHEVRDDKDRGSTRSSGAARVRERLVSQRTGIYKPHLPARARSCSPAGSSVLACLTRGMLGPRRRLRVFVQQTKEVVRR